MSWSIHRIEYLNETHVIPMGDARLHSIEDCDCGVFPLPDRPDILVHVAGDGREAFEPGAIFADQPKKAARR